MLIMIIYYIYLNVKVSSKTFPQANQMISISPDSPFIVLYYQLSNKYHFFFLPANEKKNNFILTN